MRASRRMLALTASSAFTLAAATASAEHEIAVDSGTVQLGSRPFYLVDEMSDSPLKRALQRCRGPFVRTEWSIGHRGAPLQYPEHTKESYLAAARMGAGLIECDVTYTADGELVCRHAQCDLHTTTNVLATDLAATACVEPFTPASGNGTRRATAKCCTGRLTLEQFKSLCGKMDASNPGAATIEEYLGGTTSWRTDLYTTCGTLMSHGESIDLLRELGVGMTPELKSHDPDGGFPFESQEAYASKLIQEYRQRNVAPGRVWPQSFSRKDIMHWLEEFPDFGAQAVYLDGRHDAILADAKARAGDLGALNPRDPGSFGRGATLSDIARSGVRFIAPPMQVLLTVNDRGEIAPSQYARDARLAGLSIITWTTERSGRIIEEVIADGPAESFYYSTTYNALENDGDILEILHVLAREVGVVGVFSDWPATTTFYANCQLGGGSSRRHDDQDDARGPRGPS